ncbi:hypothetical protein Ab1vBOLIVR5_gp71c [Agrobacterium phage OLIVR5]|uniref:Uncharacterized protein n=1 Tax=Agrobacterium phage OLIVR5 TaxID=2723773 RepID=A0A858MSZ1_9CAUD|nr:hypothetical protein KNU99_gp071 [Agrobacterium phage OLIVR5]QIW87719.1 hypothetical protein Ab1vBOLIVR5_gp71c [Agrobacterium phage OLIVR5]QIW87981.1 hypothetical protein Ab1vBOLIVR6_gp74c [Agrobacterium phage OLIVR6]
MKCHEMKFVDRVKAHETEGDAIDEFIAEMARIIYTFRNGDVMEKKYVFDRFSIDKFEDNSYYNWEGPKWKKGEFCISVCFEWSYQGGCDDIYITFPAAWADMDYSEWREIELARIRDENKVINAENDAREAEEARKTEQAERELYQKLRKKYEGLTK